MGEAVPIKPQRQTTEKNKYSAMHIKASLEFSLKPIVLRTYKKKCNFSMNGKKSNRKQHNRYPKHLLNNAEKNCLRTLKNNFYHNSFKGTLVYPSLP